MAQIEWSPNFALVKDPVVQDALYRIWGLLQRDRTRLGWQTGTLLGLPKTLQAVDAGQLYYAGDYDRFYVWQGSTWRDLPGQTPRGLVGFFRPGDAPAVGWALSDGRLAVRSTSDGRTETFQTMVVQPIDRLQAWVRL